MARYNHAFTIAFSTVSSDAKGEDLDPGALKAALQARIAELDREDTWIEAVGPPFDSYLEPEESS